MLKGMDEKYMEMQFVLAAAGPKDANFISLSTSGNLGN